MPVGNHDCLFQSEAVHSSYASSRQFAYREPCGAPNGGYPTVRRAAKAGTACDCSGRRIAGGGFGLKPLSTRTEARLCV